MSDLALVKRDTVDVVSEKIREFQEKGEIHFPAGYSPENAMKSAWLILQSTLDKERNPVLYSCSKDSIANALLDMVVQGLNPAKKQVYFIAYGKNLVCQRSYFGTMAVTKRVTGAKDIYAEVVYQGDDFEFEIFRGKKKVRKHVQSIDSINAGQIVGAYCTIILSEDDEFTEFMTMEEIRQSWSMSRNNPNSESSTHSKFPAEMAKRTVINRACKNFMNTSDDSSLLMKHFNRQDEVIEQAAVEAEISENANQETIDVDYTVVDDDALTQNKESSAPSSSAGGAPF